MTYTPCADRTNDPQDWFIRPDGKQYSDEDLLTEQERHRITLSVLRVSGETADEHENRCRAARNAARNNRRRSMLTRRRQAKDLCWTKCEMREACLEQALERVERHGTWGGYLEEEITAIREEQARRRRRRPSITT